MKSTLSLLTYGIKFEGSIQRDSQNLFIAHNKDEVAGHSLKVAYEARRIALLFGIEEEKVSIAAYLHDISQVIPDDSMVEFAKNNGIEVLREEMFYPRMLHQKLSRLFAFNVFSIYDEAVLNAIECHTTLKSDPSRLDMVLFISDKISWDRSYNEAFIDSIYDGFSKSLEHGCYAYIKYQIDNKENLHVLHPWTIEAYNYLHDKCDA